jgi:hypothetical protein
MFAKESTPTRNELLQQGGNFSVHELREFGLGPKKLIDGNLGRSMLYVDDKVPVRLVPLALLDLAQAAINGTENVGPAIEMLWTSFYAYRATVNRDLMAPFVKKSDGVWEWPELTDSKWGDEKTKTLAFLFGAYKRINEPTVAITEGNVQHSLQIVSGVVSNEVTSTLIAHPDEHVKYTIPYLSDVRMMNAQAWQTYSLRNWAGRGMLSTAFERFIGHEPDPEAADYIQSLLRQLHDNIITFPVARFAGDNEKTSARSLYILEF